MFKQLAVAGLRRGFGAVKALRSRYTRRRTRTRTLLRLTRGFMARSRYSRHLNMPRHHTHTPKTRRVFWGLEPGDLRNAHAPALAKLSGKPVNRAGRFSGKYGPPPRPLARRKSLEVRVAETEAEVRAAQRLRYQVFYEEMSAQASPRMAAERRDFDDFDPFADHLLVLHPSRIPDDANGLGVPAQP